MFFGGKKSQIKIPFETSYDVYYNINIFNNLFIIHASVYASAAADGDLEGGVTITQTF